MARSEHEQQEEIGRKIEELEIQLRFYKTLMKFGIMNSFHYKHWML